MGQLKTEVVLMNKIEIRIWERDFELTVVYQNYPGEEITDNQLKTLQGVKEADYSVAKKGVEQYILKNFKDELGEDDLSNIFRFVMPKSILISRSPIVRVFSVMCNFKLDMEHGIAIVFENENYKDAGPQDIIL